MICQKLFARVQLSTEFAGGKNGSLCSLQENHLPPIRVMLVAVDSIAIILIAFINFQLLRWIIHNCYDRSHLTTA